MPDNPRPYLLWLDLETTGLDPAQNRILEVGAILTNSDLREIASYHEILYCPRERIDALITSDYVHEMHVDNGLLAACTAATATLPDVTAGLLELLGYVPQARPVTLAGSGVSHFDLLWLREWMPRVAEALTYYTVDIGVVRRYLRNVVGLPEPDREPIPHRALADARLHLDEARAYRDLLRESHDIANGREDGHVEALEAIAENTREVAGSLARIETAFSLGRLTVEGR